MCTVYGGTKINFKNFTCTKELLNADQMIQVLKLCMQIEHFQYITNLELFITHIVNYITICIPLYHLQSDFLFVFMKLKRMSSYMLTYPPLLEEGLKIPLIVEDKFWGFLNGKFPSVEILLPEGVYFELPSSDIFRLKFCAVFFF